MPQNLKNIFFQFGVGGENKINSSSIILREWQHDGEERVWGKFYNLFQDHRLKLKELVLQPNQGMSFQRHHKLPTNNNDIKLDYILTEKGII